ncbi:MAG: hypothetical protein U1F36_09855 [Planctomycetota bacterium]
MTETATPPPTHAAHKHDPRADSVIIRPWPKIVFLYPTMLCAMVCWLFQFFGAGKTEVAAGIVEVGSRACGNTFLTVFFLNLLVFAFDFSRIKSITLIALLAALLLGLGWADSVWNIGVGIRSVLGSIDVRMNTQFYGFTAVFLTVMMLCVLVNTRFNYYEVNHREILHHHGYLGDITRMPTSGLRLNKEIYDLFEFALLRSGRLIFYPSTSREAIVIENVLNVNRVEERIKDLLAVIAVKMQPEE